MKKTALIISAIVLTMGTAWWSSATIADSQTHPTAAASASRAMAISLVAEDSKYSYVGSSKCKMCHIKQHRSWKKTKMALAFNTLKPGNATDIKAKFGLDPNKDYSTDAACVKCHTVGFGYDSGYSIPDPADKKAVKKAKKLAGVGCESCHGPGSEYIKMFKEIFKSRRKYKVEELYAVGLTKMDANTCTTCHNGEGPTTPDEEFNYDKMKEQGTHEHIPLKQRVE